MPSRMRVDETFFMKKRLILVATGLACVFIAGYFVHAWLTKTRINRETFDRIEVGMTLAEVEDLIGVPPGNYETRQRRFIHFANETFILHLMADPPVATWSSNDGEITIRLSNDARVAHKDFEEIELESLQDTIWRRLGFSPQQSEVTIID
jgi:hypothetical protein